MNWIRNITLLNLFGLAFSTPAWAYVAYKPTFFEQMLNNPVAILIIVAIVVGIGLYIHHSSKSGGGTS